MGLRGAWVSKFSSSKHGYVAYQIEGKCELNMIQVNFPPRAKRVTLRDVEVKNDFIKECGDLPCPPSTARYAQAKVQV